MKLWGDELSRLPDQLRKISWHDMLVVVVLGGFLFGLIHLAGQWTRRPYPSAAIDLSAWDLPYYAFMSLMRCLCALLLSLSFALVFGTWTVKDPVANQYFWPILDMVRRGVPALGFMPVLVMAMSSVLPGRMGLELSALLLIFVAQFWPITSSFRQGLRSVPADCLEMAQAYRFSGWQRFKWVELPSTATGLVWNSIMGMSRGWFVLMASETFVLGTEDFSLPGIGSYLRTAVEQGRADCVLMALGTMALVIVFLDQLLWQPLIVWTQKFRLGEEGDDELQSNWVLDALAQVRNRTLLHWYRRLRRFDLEDHVRGPAVPRLRTQRTSVALAFLLRALFWLALLPLAYGTFNLLLFLAEIRAGEWLDLMLAGFTSLGRVLLAVAAATVVGVPAGLAIGLSRRLSRRVEPVVQVFASFPSTLWFPLIIATFQRGGVSLGWGSIVLLYLPAQSYILFNSLAGAMAIPGDLKEAARSFRITGWQQFWALHLPAIFPFLVRGWDAALGVAWSTCVIAEFTTLNDEVLQTYGLGAWISRSAHDGDFTHVAASVLMMLLIRETFNRLVLERAYRLARTRFSLDG